VDDEGGESPEEFIETQWTPDALSAYRSSAEVLVQRLQEHVRLTAGRQGRQRELGAYFTSAEQVQEALNAFAGAEFDWCGSFPVRTSEALEGYDDEDVEAGPVSDPSVEQAPIVSVLGRWDYVVTDVAALVEHGRGAYLRFWPDDTADDADVRVTDVTSAIREILHAARLRDLEESPGLEPALSTVELVRHAGTSEDELLEDPFAVRDL
jgi:hypothetical protein